MDVQIKHNGTDISGHVISYNREHKLCTGIGMLELVVDYTYGTSFDPWDIIDIYENGDHAAKYYVSSASEGQPSATVEVTAQDNSKRLSDYFITDSYLINYPSYTRYWIETFLTEVGISYTFLTDSQGNLLSNNTALGLMTAYEQVLMLLQMSGWYITFNAAGKAFIGKLNTDSAVAAARLTNRDILEIKVDKNDRMYRNRVVVWGNGDPSTSRWVFADVSKPTKWDYDSRDKRTILISNSNIPTVADAFMLANQALTEFARLNVEKYLTVTGARDVMVGDVVSVKTKVFTGKGLVTTFGVSMSKEGLISNISLDERCPRLFGFFNPGGYVYVGTYGSGVWRKHILDYTQGIPSGVVLSGLATNTYSGVWFDYSSGLMDLNVTDLHVNNGILACVTTSGSLYYSIEDITPWSGVALSGLQVMYSGTLVEPTVYSGLMGRACIIDRDTNYLRYAVDTGSGINLGDFLMETQNSGIINGGFQYSVGGVLIGSGIAVSGGRSWVLDANPYDGLVENTYSVNLSGQYNFLVYDIENDGTYDYIDVLTIGSGIIPQPLANSQHLNALGPNRYFEQMEYDPYLVNTMAYSGYPTPVRQSLTYINAGNAAIDPVFAMYDNTPAESAYVAWGASALHFIDLKVWKITLNALGNPVGTTYTSRVTVDSDDVLFIDRTSSSTYRYYVRVGTTVYKYEYNILSSSVSTTTVCTLPSSSINYIVRGGYLYQAEIVTSSYGFDLKLHRTNLTTGVSNTSTVLTKTGTGTTAGSYLYKDQVAKIIPYGDSDIILLCPYSKITWVTDGVNNGQYSIKIYRYSMIGYGAGGTDDLVDDWSSKYGNTSVDSFGTYRTTMKDASGTTGNEPDWGSFNKNRVFYVYSTVTSVGTADTIYDFADSVTVTTASSTPDLQLFNKVYNLFDRTDISIGRKGTDQFYFINPNDGTVVSSIPVPAGYHLFDFAGYDTYNSEMYFRASTSASPTLPQMEMVSINSGGVITRRTDAMTTNIVNSEYTIGNFRYVSEIRPQWYYIKPRAIQGNFPMYMVLQREGYDFNVVKSGLYQDRLDISIYSPLVTMGRQIDTTQTYLFSTDSSVLQTTNSSISGYNLGMDGSSGSISGMFVLADDFRYSDFEDVIESGTSRRLFIVYSGGVGSIDIWTMSSFSGEFVSPSGLSNRIEISNFSLPDQYVFVSVSGYTNTSGVWGFFQKSPSYSGYIMNEGVFVDYSSGYPQARTTIIRLDDSI